ncbi:MAG TPA: hypothetical protein VE396_16370 [Xanthobacteraceae bacterium]|jgi:hypothetical protein|nr:hypothetical protein [Xanthobacteraceae bacterium]
MSQSQPSSVIQSLETVRDKVKQRLMEVPEYRAFLAVEKPIAEVADISDLVAHLQTAKQKILERLTTIREYRALLTVEKAINDISEVIEVVGNDANFDAAPAASEKAVGKKELPAIKSAAAVETQQAVPAIAATAPLGNVPPAATLTEMPETYSRYATELAAVIEAAGEQPEKSVSNPAERLSTVGFVEEWRLTALVRESSSADLANEEAQSAGEGKAEAEKAKVA